MLDLAVSVATGARVWGHFAVPEPQPALYVSLEDGRRRIKGLHTTHSATIHTSGRCYSPKIRRMVCASELAAKNNDGGAPGVATQIGIR